MQVLVSSMAIASRTATTCPQLWVVYLAFDAGEIDRPGIDLVEAFTRPMNAKIIEDLANDAG